MSNQLPLPDNWTNAVTGKCYERHQISFYTQSDISDLQAFIKFIEELSGGRVCMVEHTTTLSDYTQKIIVTFDKEIDCGPLE